MKNTYKRIVAILLLVTLTFPIITYANSNDNISITAWGAIAIDGDTGEVLYEKNPDKLLVPASITKVMTSYIIYEELEAGRLKKDSLIKVSPEVAKISRNKSYPMAVPLESGASYSVDQFIKLIMIPSASASCIAVAEHISGSEEKFVARMNETAKRMGIEANFKNSHGAKPHYTTARAMAILVKNFIDEYPDIINYTSLQGIDFNGKRYNILNKLMHSMRYEGVDGFKTGTISEARYCLASTGKKDNRRVISIVLGSSTQNNRYTDSKKVLDLAFQKVKDKDRSRDDKKIEFINQPKELRKNIEYKTKLKFSNLSRSYRTSGRFYIDGELEKEFKNINARNGLELYIPIVKNDSDKDSLEIKFELDRPKKDPKVIVEEIKVSDKKPALYKDLDNDEIEEKLVKLSNENIMKGIGRGYFGYKELTNRGDFITVLGRLAESQGLEEINNKNNIYNDVKDDDYFNKYTIWSREEGLSQGYNNNFFPRRMITLEEAARILDSFYTKYDIEIEDRNLDIKVLDENLSSWSEDSMEKISKKDLFYNRGDILDPKEKLAREDLVNIIWRSLEEIENMEEVK